MNGAILLLVGVVCFTLAYFFYSKFIARAIGIDPDKPTPAHTMGPPSRARVRSSDQSSPHSSAGPP